MDLELHQLARELLHQRLAEQRAAGALQVLHLSERRDQAQHLHQEHSPQRRVRRRELMPEEPLHVGSLQPGAP